MRHERAEGLRRLTTGPVEVRPYVREQLGMVAWELVTAACCAAALVLRSDGEPVSGLRLVVSFVAFGGLNLYRQLRTMPALDDLPPAPPDVRRWRPEWWRQLLLGPGFLVAIVGFTVAFDALAGDDAAYVVPAATAGIATAYLVTAGRLAWWQRRHRRQLLRVMGERAEGAPDVYVR